MSEADPTLLEALAALRIEHDRLARRAEELQRLAERAAAVAAAAHATASARPRPSAGRILVADDLTIIQDLTKSLLESAGHSVDVVSDGTAAVAAVEANAYDVVLMDVQMPGMDGVFATRRIRSMPPPMRNVPIIAFTAQALPQHLRTFREAGMNDLVAKPVNRKDLFAKIEAWLPGGAGHGAAPFTLRAAG